MLLSTAIKLARLGYWVIAIRAPGEQLKDRVAAGKEPIGAGWGIDRWTEGKLRAALEGRPKRGIGVCLGPGRGPDDGWLIDLEGDGEEADGSLASLLGGEVVGTVSWGSTRGSHSLFLADGERLLRALVAAGAKEGKGEGKSGVWKLPRFPDLEFRIGGFKPDGTVKQVQSVVPPTPGTDGTPRTWAISPRAGVAALPESAYAFLESIAEPRRDEVPAATRRANGNGRGSGGAGANDVESRVVKYLATIEPAISGQNGSGKTFGAACRVGPGFDLDPGEAFRLINTHYNPRCVPPWSEAELRHKIDDAYRVKSERGWLLNAGQNGDGYGNGNGNGNGHHPSSPNGASPPSSSGTVPVVIKADGAPIYLTELGNARRLIARYADRLHYCAPLGRWFEWDGSRWCPDRTGAIWRWAKAVIDDLRREAAAVEERAERLAIEHWALKSEQRKVLSATIDLAWSEPGVSIEPEDLDRDPWLLNCPNGTVDLRTGEVRPPRREDLMSKITRVPCADSADCPRWLDTLDFLFGGNVEMAAYVRRALGYSLTGDIGEHAMFLCYGTGRNGKNTILDSVRLILGDYATVADPRTFLAAGQGEHPAALADLTGRRFVPTSEVEEGEKLAEGLVKRVTGDQTLKARFMRQDPFEFPVLFKLWMLANCKPEIRGQDEGIWSRIRIVPFEVFIPPERRIKNFSNVLVKEEGPGILRWLIDGCLEWQKVGLAEPERVVEANEMYRSESDVIGNFLGQRTVDHREDNLREVAVAKTGLLYLDYVEWCRENGEKNVLSTRKFGSEMTRRGYKLIQRNGVSYRMGMLLIDDNQRGNGGNDDNRPAF